jgi:hypothetical protein
VADQHSEGVSQADRFCWWSQHTASSDSATVLEAGVCMAFPKLRRQVFAFVVRFLPRRLMVDCRWSASRSFRLAAARLRGLHLDHRKPELVPFRFVDQAEPVVAPHGLTVTPANAAA